MHLETEGRGAGRQVLRDHVPEMVGWLAASRNHGSLGQVTYDAGITPSEVHETPYEFPFAGAFRFPPKLFGSIGTYHGSDSAQLRQTRPATTMSFEVMIEEEQCTGETEGGFTHPWAEEVRTSRPLRSCLRFASECVRHPGRLLCHLRRH